MVKGQGWRRSGAYRVGRTRQLHGLFVLDSMEWQRISSCTTTISIMSARNVSIRCRTWSQTVSLRFTSSQKPPTILRRCRASQIMPNLRTSHITHRRSFRWLRCPVRGGRRQNLVLTRWPIGGWDLQPVRTGHLLAGLELQIFRWNGLDYRRSPKLGDRRSRLWVGRRPRQAGCRRHRLPRHRLQHRVVNHPQLGSLPLSVNAQVCLLDLSHLPHRDKTPQIIRPQIRTYGLRRLPTPMGRCVVISNISFYYRTCCSRNMDVPARVLQEAQLSQRNRATLHVIEYSAKSLEVVRNDCWVGRA